MVHIPGHCVKTGSGHRQVTRLGKLYNFGQLWEQLPGIMAEKYNFAKWLSSHILCIFRSDMKAMHLDQRE